MLSQKLWHLMYAHLKWLLKEISNANFHLQIAVQIPHLRLFKSIVDRFKNLANMAMLKVNSEGQLTLTVETDQVSVTSHFDELSVEKHSNNLSKLQHFTLIKTNHYPTGRWRWSWSHCWTQKTVKFSSQWTAQPTQNHLQYIIFSMNSILINHQHFPIYFRCDQ